MSNIESNQKTTLFQSIKSLIENARSDVIRTVNTTMVVAYFEIGRMIVEDEQRGYKRAQYSEQVLKTLSGKLTKEFGRGFSVTNLQQMRQFFFTYQKQQTVSVKFENIFKLSWSHYLQLIRIDNINERNFYEIEAVKQNWSVRELERQYNSSLYERLVLSRDKKKAYELSQKGQIIEKAKDVIKEPFILEFLGLEEKDNYRESDIETAIIDKLEQFLLELGKGFLFAGRQARISFDKQHFWVDLVLYNRLL